ncbi:MAG: prepilin-type N-terminal cleavage/methylation domain-containing protein, partial [Bdellovibrionota bacterium]
MTAAKCAEGGFSLLEVMMAIGIAAILTYAVATM